jgi:hypothetical protein
MGHIATGTLTQAATAVAVNISCGFHPSYVKIWNTTDGVSEEWIRGMTDAHGIVHQGDLTSTSTAADTAVKVVTALGITPSGDATTDTFKGFTFGLQTDINIASKVYFWVAMTQDGG